MMEFIVLSILILGVLGLAGFIYWHSQKQIELFRGEMKSINEMLMAGSFQEWQRVKTGKPPIPNTLKSEPNFQDLREEEKIPWSAIENVKVDNEPKRKIKIYH